ncbi:MAG: hypothetical protein O2930_12395 [Acidobacteria bacterium]|nr:hypothetical protein [Acidobacteriota bacterium]
MWHYLVDSRGHIGVDYIGRFECLVTHFRELCAALDRDAAIFDYEFARAESCFTALIAGRTLRVPAPRSTSRGT